MNPTVRQLRAFLFVADTGGFTAAARRMHLTQSAVSLLVRELEKELGFSLLDRNTRNVALSTAGAEFYPMAQKVLQDLDVAVSSAQQLQQRKRGIVRVAATLLYSSTLLPPAIAEHRRLHPGVSVQLQDRLNEAVLGAVIAGEADFGIAPQQRLTSVELVKEVLFLDPTCLMCPPDHAFAQQRAVSWKAALRQPFICPAGDYRRRLQQDLSAASADLLIEPDQEVSHITTALGMVQAGLGVTALPQHATILARSFGLSVVPLQAPVVRRQVSVFVRRGKPLSAAAESFLALLRAQLAPRAGRRVPA